MQETEVDMTTAKRLLGGGGGGKEISCFVLQRQVGTVVKCETKTGDKVGFNVECTCPSGT
jgi:hypothetical protein